MNAKKLLEQATNLAYRAIGYTKMNPMVGCIIMKDEKIIGQGWHKYFGGAHAEVNAIRNAEQNGHSVEGAHVFLTLEPCLHHGKTPPCVDLLIEKKVREVCVLFPDENPLVAGKSLEKLQAHKIKIYIAPPSMQRSYQELYADFFFHIREKTSFVSIKMAMDKRGNIARPNEETKITGSEAKIKTHFLRQRYDSILVGSKTVEIDDPHLGVRYGDFFQGARDPLRIILDPHARLGNKYEVFRDENFLLICFPEHEKIALQKFGKRVISVPYFEENSRQVFDLLKLVKMTYEREIPSILVEGGSYTLREFFEQKCFQRWYFFLSPHDKTGENGVPGIDFQKISEFVGEYYERLGEDTLWAGKFVQPEKSTYNPNSFFV